MSEREILTSSLQFWDSSNSPSDEIQSSQEISLDEYEWPSEASRYRTVAANHELLALTADEAKQTISCHQGKCHSYIALWNGPIPRVNAPRLDKTDAPPP